MSSTLSFHIAAALLGFIFPAAQQSQSTSEPRPQHQQQTQPQTKNTDARYSNTKQPITRSLGGKSAHCPTRARQHPAPAKGTARKTADKEVKGDEARGDGAQRLVRCWVGGCFSQRGWWGKGVGVKGRVEKGRGGSCGRFWGLCEVACRECLPKSLSFIWSLWGLGRGAGGAGGWDGGFLRGRDLRLWMMGCW